jgi:hypothetical protein
VVIAVVSLGLAAQILTVGSPLVAADVAQAIARLPGRMTVRAETIDWQERPHRDGAIQPILPPAALACR